MYEDTPTPCLENWTKIFKKEKENSQSWRRTDKEKSVCVPPPPPPPHGLVRIDVYGCF